MLPVGDLLFLFRDRAICYSCFGRGLELGLRWKELCAVSCNLKPVMFYPAAISHPEFARSKRLYDIKSALCADWAYIIGRCLPAFTPLAALILQVADLEDILKEKGECGVGYIANIKNKASHKIVQQALTALGCMEHRGGCSADNDSGDGAGVMTKIPWALFQDYFKEKGLPALDEKQTGVGMLFLPKDPEHQKAAKACESVVDRVRFLGRLCRPGITTIGEAQSCCFSVETFSTLPSAEVPVALRHSIAPACFDKHLPLQQVQILTVCGNCVPAEP